MVVTLACLTLLVSSCAAGAPKSAASVITGAAAPCVGAASQANYDKIPVRVTLTQGSRTIASQVIDGRGTYRFKEPQGTYVVSTDQPYVAPVHVTTRSGEASQVDLVPSCK